MPGFDRIHKPPSVPLKEGEDPEPRLMRVVYGPCDGCTGERPFGVPADDPILPEHEYIDMIVFLDEILEHCHFPKVQ